MSRPPPAGNKPEAIAKHLQAVPLLCNLSPSELADVVRAARSRRVTGGDYFFQQGEEASDLYVLAQGRVKLTQSTPEGHQVLLRFIQPDEMFGGIAALGNRIYPASAEAVEDCQALAWGADAIASLMGRYPRLALNALELLAAQLQELQERFQALASERVERRVARALVRLTGQAGRKVDGGVLIDLPLSRQDLAEMTGTTLFTVSRLLSRWQQQGVIETGRERVLIRSPHSLVMIAEDELPPAADEA